MRMDNGAGARARRFGFILAFAFVGVTACASASFAATTHLPTVIAPISADVPISAGGGWLIWSVRVKGGWGLEAYHDGTLTTLPVSSRAQPFDVNVGTDLRGAPVALFSRCAWTPEMSTVGSGEVGSGGAMLIPSSGSGCRLRMLELKSGVERSVPVPHPSDTSDTTPSMWRGEVAFARKTPGHGDVSQILLWSPRHPHALRSLPNGAVFTNCGDRTCVEPFHGEVQALDFDGRVVTFLWSVEGPGVFGDGGWEVRVDDLTSAVSKRAALGYVVEACVGFGGIELERFEAPIAVGQGALFSELQRFGCYARFRSLLYRYRAGSVHPKSEIISGFVLGLAKDGDTLYALSAPPPGAQSNPSCSSAAPCMLEQVASLSAGTVAMSG